MAKIVALRSAFEPAPLLELFRQEGAQVWCAREGAVFLTCILKA